MLEQNLLVALGSLELTNLPSKKELRKQLKAIIQTVQKETKSARPSNGQASAETPTLTT